MYYIIKLVSRHDAPELYMTTSGGYTMCSYEQRYATKFESLADTQKFFRDDSYWKSEVVGIKETLQEEHARRLKGNSRYEIYCD